MIKVVDLFSGAGGLTYGFQKKIHRNRFVDNNSFQILMANEVDSDASFAFKMNFPEIPLLEMTIEKLTPSYLRANKIDVSDVDLIIGGPPCQSYSTVGKRQYDARATMYEEYRRLLSFIQPKVFIFENVTGLKTMKNNEGKPVIEDIVQAFSNFEDFKTELGYNLNVETLNSKYYGVPQSRERVFLVGVRKDLEIKHPWEFPQKKIVKERNCLTVEDAIGDLPSLENGETKDSYCLKPNKRYQYLMRGNSKVLRNHVNGLNGERMLKIMAAVSQGEGKRHINEQVKNGILDEELYLTSGYDNTYGRLWWNQPSTTITNSMTTPSSLRCIHPLQNRAISPREGARIQSFPDSFIFSGSKEKITSQIGNAVPPILAIAIAEEIERFFQLNFN